MNFLSYPFKQFRLVIVLTSLVAIIYVLNFEMTLLQPLLFFSAFLVSCINIAEVFYKRESPAVMCLVHICVSILLAFGFVFSIIGYV